MDELSCNLQFIHIVNYLSPNLLIINDIMRNVNIKTLTNCLIKNVTRDMIKKGSLTHNGCYPIRGP